MTRGATISASLDLAAQDYPALNLFWTMLEVFIWIAWLLLLFRIIGDIFSSPDLGGGGKAGWSLFVIILPFLGVLVYLIARGGGMQQRAMDRAKAQDEAMRAYVQQAAGTTSNADELNKLASLHTSGVLTDAEFATQKAKLLGV